MKYGVLILSAAALVGTSFVAVANEADRRAGMKQIAGAVKMISGGTNVAENAQALADAAAQIPAWFEANEISADSKARPEIWTNFDDFTAKANSLETAALAVLAAANDSGDVGAAAKAIGGACGACHKDYKLK